MIIEEKIDLIYRGFTIKSHWTGNGCVVQDAETGVEISQILKEDFKDLNDVRKKIDEMEIS
jgi:hypothetical protein